MEDEATKLRDDCTRKELLLHNLRQDMQVTKQDMHQQQATFEQQQQQLQAQHQMQHLSQVHEVQELHRMLQQQQLQQMRSYREHGHGPSREDVADYDAASPGFQRCYVAPETPSHDVADDRFDDELVTGCFVDHREAAPNEQEQAELDAARQHPQQRHSQAAASAVPSFVPMLSDPVT